jgi:hypothetical protein
VSEDSEPDQPGELADGSKPLIPRIKPIIPSAKPLIPQIKLIIPTDDAWMRQLEPIIKGNEALWRQVEPIVQAAEWFTQAGGGWPALRFSLQVALAVDARMRVLLPSPESQVIDYAVFAQVATATATAPSPTVNATATAAGEGTVTASGSVTPPPLRTGLAAMSDGQIVFLVLVWLYAFVLPWFGAALPPEYHAILSDHYATIAIALGITWQMHGKSK